MSSKIYRSVFVFIVIMLLSAGLYKSLLGSNSESWEKVGFESVKASMQKGLAQLHWQWEFEGRPLSIVYETAGITRIDRIDINKNGWPDLAPSTEACTQLLHAFASAEVAEVSGLQIDVDVEKQLGIKIEFVAKQKIHDSGELVDVCRYSRKGQKFEYYLGTGNLF